MIWIPIAVFALVLLVVVGGYFLLWAGRSEKAEVKRRISLLELRNLRDSDVPEFLKNEVLSEVPLLNRLLSRVNIAARIDRRLRQADMKIPVGTFLLLSLVLFSLGIVRRLDPALANHPVGRRRHRAAHRPQHHRRHQAATSG